MGLLDALSAGIGAAAPAGAALAQGQAQATQSNTGFLEKLAQMQQQRQAADMQRQLQTAQIGDIQAQQKQREQQADALAKKFTPENVGAMAKQWGVDVNTAEAMMRDPATLRTVLESKKNPASIPGTKEWKEAETFKAGLTPRTKLTPVVDPSDPTGQRIIYVPSEQAAGMRAPTKLGASGSRAGLGQRAEAGLLSAVSEAQSALDRMQKYEDKKLTEGPIGPVEKGVNAGKSLLGSWAMLNPAHDPFKQSVGESVLGTVDPELEQYRRDAGLISRAEQLMGAGSRSEAAAAMNQLLARASSNWDKASVMAARRSRESVVGKFGGIAQTLSSEQADKLNRALQAMNNNQSDFPYIQTGAEVFGGGTANPPAPTGKHGAFSDLVKKP
jgi:hypothetical protein